MVAMARFSKFLKIHNLDNLIKVIIQPMGLRVCRAELDYNINVHAHVIHEATLRGSLDSAGTNVAQRSTMIAIGIAGNA